MVKDAGAQVGHADLVHVGETEGEAKVCLVLHLHVVFAADIPGGLLHPIEEPVESFFRHAFDSPVVVYSPTQNRSIKEHIRWVKASPEITYSDLLNTHDFDRVIYISNTLDPTGDGSWDIGDLRTCLHSLKKQSGVKFVYIGSNRVLQDDDNSQKVVCQSFEDLCTFFRNNRGVETLMVRSPYLCNPSSSVDFLYRAFEELEMEGSYTMPGRPEQLSNCMSIQDLADLLHRLFVDWRSEIEVIDLIPQRESHTAGLLKR